MSRLTQERVDRIIQLGDKGWAAAAQVLMP